MKVYSVYLPIKTTPPPTKPPFPFHIPPLAPKPLANCTFR